MFLSNVIFLKTLSTLVFFGGGRGAPIPLSLWPERVRPKSHPFPAPPPAAPGASVLAEQTYNCFTI